MDLSITQEKLCALHKEMFFKYDACSSIRKIRTAKYHIFLIKISVSIAIAKLLKSKKRINEKFLTGPLQVLSLY